MKKITFVIMAIYVHLFSLAQQSDSNSYVFDRVNQIVKQIHNKSYVLFSYDANGNRKQVVDVLPLQLLSFTASKQKQQVLLTWQTENEINALIFDIQFSIDGSSFQTFSSLDAHGVTQKTTYTANHCCPMVGVNYYRLKIIDKDGKVTFSPIRKVVFEGANTFKVFPNPVYNSSALTISFANSLRLDADVYVYSSTGAKVLSAVFPKNASQYSLELPSLASGIYFILVNTHEELFQTKFVKL